MTTLAPSNVRGTARPSWAWTGDARHGVARSRLPRLGPDGSAWARSGWTRWARPAYAGLGIGTSCHGAPWSGGPRLDKASLSRLAGVRLGTPWLGVSGSCRARQRRVRHGRPTRGSPRRGAVGQAPSRSALPRTGSPRQAAFGTGWS